MSGKKNTWDGDQGIWLGSDVRMTCNRGRYLCMLVSTICNDKDEKSVSQRMQGIFKLGSTKYPCGRKTEKGVADRFGEPYKKVDLFHRRAYLRGARKFINQIN